eukprot:9099416-Heterocapsa_arctica.AAC.1
MHPPRPFIRALMCRKIPRVWPTRTLNSSGPLMTSVALVPLRFPRVCVRKDIFLVRGIGRR